MSYIGRGTFSGCDSLKGIVLPENIETIDEICFENCTSLSSVTLPVRLLFFGGDVFKGCSKLDTVIAKSSSPFDKIYESTFPVNTYLNGTLFVPKGSKAIYQNAEIWKNFINIVESEHSDPTSCPLTVTVSGGGYVTFLGQTLKEGSLDWFVNADSSFYISAYPDPGYSATITVRDDNGNSSTTEGQYSSELKKEVETGEVPLTIEVTFTKISVTLTVQQAESGCVEMETEYGKTRKVRITPYDGWYINSVTLDGKDYTYMLDADNCFITPELYGNAFLNVAFEQYNSDGVRNISTDKTKVYAKEGHLVIEQATLGSPIHIYDESGRQVEFFTANAGRMEITLPANHVYIVKTPQKSVKIKL